jgi:hypothetical protein
MVSFNPEGRLVGLTDNDWEKISYLLESKRFSISFSSRSMGILPEKLIAVMFCLYQDDLCKLYINIYHTCEDHPVMTRDYQNGMPRFPFHCEECEEHINDSSTLSYDLECIIPKPLIKRTSIVDKLQRLL